MTGQTISHYKILDKLGEGGMGVVYKAQDTRLNRLVALKFLPQHIAVQEAEQARFLQEARAASALNHPNVCTIYDIKEAEHREFIVMEYVDGETIRQKSPVPKVQDALSYALQIGEALHEAHTKGIVHRDIKSENIMVNTKNQIKVMDFGLAKLKGSLKLTKTSSTVGTLAYMAPEQLHGGDADTRSDIFSFGVVLFEMLTGTLPFRGEHEAALMYSIVNDEPQPVQKLRPEAPAEIERIIRRALEKDPEDRYQHIDDMVSELRRVMKQSTRVSRTMLRDLPQEGVMSRPAEDPAAAGTAGGTAVPGRKRWFVPAGVILAVVAIATVIYLVFYNRHVAIDSIAVLPFTNASADSSTEYLSDGVTESIINTLSQISNLSVKSRNAVFHYKGNNIDPQKAGKELGVKAVLTGRLMQRGDALQISTELVDVAGNNQIWGEQFNRKTSDILAVQEVIAKEISQNLQLKLAGEDEKKLAKHATENTEAYQLYLKGRFHWNKRKAADLMQAVDYFNQAIVKDPGYALAYAGLASTYALLPEYGFLPVKEYIPKAEAAVKKALDLDPSLAEPHAVLGLLRYSHQWDWAGAESELKRAIELDPNYPTVHHWYSICLRQQGKVDEAYREIRRAQELDPLSPVISLNVAEVLSLMQHDDQTMEQIQKTLELDAQFPGAYAVLARRHLTEKKYDEAISEILKVRQIVGESSPFGLGLLGYSFAKAGKKDEADKVLGQLGEFSRRGLAVATEEADVYVGLNDLDNAFNALDKAYEDRSTAIGYLKIIQTWDVLRPDPRYSALLKKLGLEK